MNTQRAIRELRTMLKEAGLSGSFLVRDLATGDELGIAPDVELPIASLVKVPLAVAVLQRVQDGRLDGAAMIDVPPGRNTSPAQVGLSRFRHPARIAVEDLLQPQQRRPHDQLRSQLRGVPPQGRPPRLRTPVEGP
jgi:beta-lactamase class A